MMPDVYTKMAPSISTPLTRPHCPSRRAGEPNRLRYGYDAWGNRCGSANNAWNGGAGPDLTNRTKLYYLDPFSAGAAGLKYAKSVCVEACPGEADACGAAELPCTDEGKYRCPYYR